MTGDAPPRRQLKAILALDIAGYSKMMGANEELTLAALKAARSDVIDPEVHSHRGRVIKSTGDGILADFDSAKDAINCAMLIQEGLSTFNKHRDPAFVMKARIGINVGDIILEDGDVFGDGVNIAARLEALAPIGGICISDKCLGDVRQLGLPYLSGGKVQLKNIRGSLGVIYVGAAPQSKASRIGRWRWRILVMLLVFAVAAAAALSSFRSRYSSDPAGFLAAKLDQVPCGWLQLVRIGEAPDGLSVEIEGATFAPQIIASMLTSDANKAGIKLSTVNTDRVLPIDRVQCDWIEALRTFRYKGVPRARVVDKPDSDGKDFFDFEVDRSKLKKNVSMFFIDRDGKASSTREMFEDDAFVDGQDGRKTLKMFADHSGVSGIFLWEADRVQHQLGKSGLPPSTVAGAGEILRRGKLEGWQFEMFWFETHGVKDPIPSKQ